MSKFIKIIKDLFSFTRGERIGVAVLMIILAAVFVYPVITKQNEDDDNENFEEFKAQIDEFENKIKNEKTYTANEKTNGNEKKEIKAKVFVSFYFDPNTISADSLMLLGFSEKQTGVILNYRKKVKFKTADDFGKVYVVSENFFGRLKPYINIKNAEICQNVNLKATEKKYKTIEMVEINSADTVELKKLRGIGSYYAKKIIEYREKIGGFVCAEQLKEIWGIDDERFQLFENQIIVDKDAIAKIKINEIDERSLAKNKYIGYKIAKEINHYRKITGKITDLKKLVNENIISNDLYNKILPYIEY